MHVDTSSNLCNSSRVCGSVVRSTAGRENAEYAGITSSHIFCYFTSKPWAPLTISVLLDIETMGPINDAGKLFLSEIYKCFTTNSDNPMKDFFNAIPVLFSILIKFLLWIIRRRGVA